MNDNVMQHARAMYDEHRFGNFSHGRNSCERFVLIAIVLLSAQRHWVFEKDSQT